MSKPMWGFPWHGLLVDPRGIPRLRVGGGAGPEMLVEEPIFPAGLNDRLGVYGQYYREYYSDFRDTHMVRAPGIPEITLSPEEVAANAAMGRSWWNYGLLVGTYMCMHGKFLRGWVCIDPADQRWLVRPIIGSCSIGSPLTVNLDVTPFGVIGGAPTQAVRLAVTLADVEQEGELLGGEPRLLKRIASVSSHGRDVLIALYPSTSSGELDLRDFPCGWLRLELIGDGPNFALQMSVIHSRNQTLGEVSEVELENPPAQQWSADINITGANDDVMIGTLSSITVEPAEYTQTQSSSRAGRILSLVFDDADQVIMMSADLTYLKEHVNGPYSVSGVSGDLRDGGGQSSSYISYTTQQTVINRSTYEVVIRRDGIPVESGHMKVVSTGSVMRDGSILRGIYVDRDPPDFNIRPVGPGYLSPSTTWATAISVKAGGSEVYSHTDHTSQGEGLPSWLMHHWGSRVAIALDLPGGPYNAASYSVRRHSNQIITAQYGFGSSLPGESINCTHRAIAAHATWDNPIGSTNEYLRGSYNPATHDLVMSQARGLDGELDGEVFFI